MRFSLASEENHSSTGKTNLERFISLEAFPIDMKGRRTFLSIMGAYLGLGASGFVNSPIGQNKGMHNQSGIYNFSRSISSNEITVSFVWQTRGVSAELETKIPRELYEEKTSKSISRRNQIQNNTDTPFLNELQEDIYESFKEGLKRYNENSGLSLPIDMFSKRQVMYSFVRSIHYQTDIESLNRFDYIRHPVEVLVDGVADCTGRTALLTGLLSTLGHKTGYVILPGHMAPLVSMDIMYDYGYDVWHATDSTEYTLIETTQDLDIGNTINEFAPEDVVYLYTLEDGFDVINPNMLPNHASTSTSNTVNNLEESSLSEWNINN